MRVPGKMIKRTEKEYFIEAMGINMKEIGKMILEMDKEFFME